jgi:type IX secretion system PorP/SprF family membrane protein
MKRIIIILVFLAAAKGTFGQQNPLYTQYMQNPFVLNPAITGTLNYYQIRFSSRFQWLNFPDAPVTNSISYYGPFSSKSKDMGIGFTMYDDVTNPTSRLGLRGAYAYNIAVSSNLRMSFGGSLGFLQYKYDGTKSNLEQVYGFGKVPIDPAAPQTVKSFFLPDGMIGTYVYNSILQAGLSVDNLFNSTVKISDGSNDAKALAKLQSHFYLFGSYTVPLNRKWKFEPSTVIRMVSSIYQFDLNTKFTYQRLTWFGLSYRSNDAISIMAGYNYKKIYIGYSFDYNISSIGTYSLGSHELMIGYKFDSLK